MRKSTGVHCYYSHPSSVSCSSADLAGLCSESDVSLGFCDGFLALASLSPQRNPTRVQRTHPALTLVYRQSLAAFAPGFSHEYVLPLSLSCRIPAVLQALGVLTSVPMPTWVDFGWDAGSGCSKMSMWKLYLPTAPSLLPFPSHCP